MSRRGSSPQGGWTPSLTPRSAVRIAMLGGVVVAMLGLLLLRLWFLQVISSEDYAARAEGNHLRTVVVEAPRGAIVDRKGRSLVTNVPGKNLVARPSELRGQRRDRVLARLAKRLDLDRQELHDAVDQAVAQGQPTAVLAENVDDSVVMYMSERWRDYPGVGLENSWVREYPEGDLAAHILGYTAKIPAEQVRDYTSQGYLGNETVGVAGLKMQYEKYLRGEAGRDVYEVEASGEPRGRVPGRSLMPRQGRTLQLSIDLDYQRALENALRSYSGASSRASGVMMDVTTGEVLAMASYPTYDPSMWAENREREISRVMNDDDNKPMFNRAIAGRYPAASTFKPFVASAAVRQGYVSSGTLVESRSTFEFYEHEFDNYKQISHGMINMATSLEVSSDTYYYQLGAKFYEEPLSKGSLLQEELSRFGFGDRTGLDLSGESTGLLPTLEWKAERFKGDALHSTWLPGDSINLSIGQGNMEVTPLQLTSAYAAIASGGVWRTPVLGKRVLDPNDRVVAELAKGLPSRDIQIPDDALYGITEGLRLVTHGSNGTGVAVFGGAPVAGKTGTAETNGEDHSLFAGYGPIDDPKIAIGIIVENAGTGSGAAAPAVCEAMAAALDYSADDCSLPPPDEAH